MQLTWTDSTYSTTAYTCILLYSHKHCKQNYFQTQMLPLLTQDHHNCHLHWKQLRGNTGSRKAEFLWQENIIKEIHVYSASGELNNNFLLWKVRKIIRLLHQPTDLVTQWPTEWHKMYTAHHVHKLRAMGELCCVDFFPHCYLSL